MKASLLFPSTYILGVSGNNKLVIALIPVNKCILWKVYLGDNCIVFENFTASIGYLMVAN